MANWATATPFEISSYDNPETIRFRKYATGTHLVVHGTEIETGLTPKEMLWQRGEAKLYHYEPTQQKKYSVPILIVYALILRPYILDLVPGNSFVEYLLGEGFDVYMLDWGIPDEEDKNLSFENYVLDYLPEVMEQVLANSLADELTLFGYCQGGTISAMYAALFPQGALKNLMLLTTPVDFAPEDPGIFGLWTLWSRQEYFNPDLLVGPSGNVPADLISRYTENTIHVPPPFADMTAATYENLQKSIEQDDSTMDTFLAVSKWVDDSVPFPGKAFWQWIRDFYQKNKLVKGELELRGQRVDL